MTTLLAGIISCVEVADQGLFGADPLVQARMNAMLQLKPHSVLPGHQVVEVIWNERWSARGRTQTRRHLPTLYAAFIFR